MPDVFDQIAPTQPVRGDVFDLIAPSQDVFEEAASEMPFISGEGAFLKLLDLINTPQQMVLGTLTAKEGETLPEAAVRGARENVGGFEVSERVMPFTEGEGWLVTNFARPAYATFTDLVVDPLIFLPLGKIGKTVQAGRKALMEIPAVAKAVEAVKPVLKPLARKFHGKAFAQQAERDFIDVLELNRAKLSLTREDIIKDAAAREKLTQAAANETGRSVDDTRRMLMDLVEEPAPPKQAELFASSQAANDAIKIIREPFGIDPRAIPQALAQREAELVGKETLTPVQVYDFSEPYHHAKVSALKKEIRAGKRLTVQVVKGDKGEALVTDGVHTLQAYRELGIADDAIPRRGRGVERIHEKATHAPGQQDMFLELKQSVADVKDASRGIRVEAPPKVRQLVQSFKSAREDILLQEQIAGLDTPELADSSLDYVLHLLTREGRKAVAGKYAPQFGREFSARHASQLARELRGMSARQINELAAAGKLPGYEGQVFKKFMVDDPVALTAVRQLRAAKAIADADLLYSAATKFGRPAGSAPAHWVELAISNSADPRVATIGEALKGIKFDPDIAAHLNNVLGTTMLPEGLETFLRVFDSIQDVWKGITLAPFPAYHLRNVVGNVWNNALGGVYSTKWYRMAESLQRGTAKVFVLNGKEVSAEAVSNLARDFGVHSGGRFVGEVPSEVSKALGRGIGARDIAGIGKVVQQGFRVGGFLEDNARLAHFLKRLDEGKGPMEAALSVKKYLFDYQHGLTDFERRVMRRIMPFYAWTRFNVPLQISSLVDNPRPFVHLAAVVRAARSDEPAVKPTEETTKLLPPFVRENVGIPIRTGPDGNPEYFLLGGWLPAADLEILGRPSGPLDRALNLLTPFVKTPTEQVFNVDLFRNRPIEKYPGQNVKFLGVSMPARAAHWLKIFRFASEVDRLTRGALESGLDETELTTLSKTLRAIFGLKGTRVSISRQKRRRRAKQEELRRMARGIGRRGDEADNLETLRELIEEPPME